MTLLRFVPAIYGLSEGGIPEGSPEAKAAIAKVAGMMSKRNSAFKKTEQATTPVTPTVFTPWFVAEMDRRGVTVETLAFRLNVQARDITAWRKGTRAPEGDRVRRLAVEWQMSIHTIEGLIRQGREIA